LEGPSLSSSKDRFQSICKALGEMQAKHERRVELLMEACQLAVCGPSKLPERIRKMMVDQARVEDSRKLREENARLNLEVGNLLNENRAAWTQAEAAAASAERIRDFVHQAGQVVAKAELFDEKVGIGRADWRRSDAGIKNFPKTQGNAEAQESWEEEAGSGNDFRV
jgi:hypothetical protein